MKENMGGEADTKIPWWVYDALIVMYIGIMGPLMALMYTRYGYSVFVTVFLPILVVSLIGVVATLGSKIYEEHKKPVEK